MFVTIQYFAFTTQNSYKYIIQLLRLMLKTIVKLLQKRAMRLITHSNYRAASTLLFSRLRMNSSGK